MYSTSMMFLYGKHLWLSSLVHGLACVKKENEMEPAAQLYVDRQDVSMSNYTGLSSNRIIMIHLTRSSMHMNDI